MIIISQNSSRVEKRIVNFDNVNYLMIDHCGTDWVIIFKDNTIPELELTNCNCLLGVYNTEERANKVLQEISEFYIGHLDCYEMPKEEE